MARGLLAMRQRGAARFLGSCEASNRPMNRVFARLGYRQEAVQHYFKT